MERKDQPKFSEVKATWFDRDEVATKEETASSSADGPEYLIRAPHRSAEEAKDAAKSKAEDLRRASGSASFEIDGDPNARAEAFAVVSGVRSRVDGTWRATTVTHSFSGSGPYTTSVECELPESGDADA